MNRGIIHTALNNATLRLELDYRLPSPVRERDASGPELTNHNRHEHRESEQPVSDELFRILQVI